MKKLVLTGIGFFLAMGLTFAQVEHKNPEEQAGTIVNTLNDQLAFSDEQKATIFTIVLEQTKQAYAVLGDSSVSDADALKKLTEIQKESDGRILPLLTEEQKTAFKQIISQRAAITLPARASSSSDESGY